MIDSVLKGTGNSRFLKSAVPAGTSWADALAMLQAGTFPIDFNGINTEGFQQVGTPLNKANLLKDATAAQIGLPPSTTPDGMFQALGNTGELHVWRKTVKNAADVPAGYTLGAAQEVELIKGKNNSGSAIAYRTITVSYSASITVSDDGKTITLVSPSTATIRSDYPAEADAIKGKFFKITQYQSTYVDVPNGVNFVPSSATFANVYPNSNGWTSLTCSAMQTVTGYAKVPAGTTTTYPVSTNPNAYQEGDDAKAAGYVVGEVVNSTANFGGYDSNASSLAAVQYSSSINVSDDGTISLSNPTTWSVTPSSAGVSYATSNIRGKFFLVINTETGSTDFIRGTVYFCPENANFNYISTVPRYLEVDCYQPVTGYPAIPARTTIEYLGKLGDKARVQVVSYVGTGTSGADNPNSLTFDFVPKLLFIKSVGNGAYYICLTLFGTTLTDTYENYAFFDAAGNMTYPDSSYARRNGKKIQWYSRRNAYAQANGSGYKYTAIAIG
nr:MAG TPA: hypothetical protein [Caudoviricetes sp.]